MMIEYLARRPAMATVVECLLIGEDSEHLEAVAAAVFDEITMLESVLSRYDPAAELARVNLSANNKPIRMSRILSDALILCDQLVKETQGAFDPCAGSGRWSDLELLKGDDVSVRFLQPGMRIDLGGFGKGFVLDRLAEFLIEYQLHHYFIHAGTSSILARGLRADGTAWRVDLPGETLELHNQSLSTSMARSTSAIVDPIRQSIVENGAQWTIVGPSAAAAEAYSTAKIVDPDHWSLPTGYRSYVTRGIHS